MAKSQDSTIELTAKEQELAKLVGLGIAFAFFAIMLALRLTGVIPGPARILQLVETGYSHYGYWLVFISAILEGLVVINLYYPGSTAILLGVIFAHRSGNSVPLIVALTVIGFMIAYSINFIAGYYGISQLLAKLGYQSQLKHIGKSLKDKGVRVILTSLFHPNLGAIVTTGAGVIRFSPYKFFISSLISLIVWDSVWASLAYFFGNEIIRLFESWLIYPVLMGWTLITLLPLLRASRSTN